MDKIDLAQWNHYFGNASSTIVHASDRYTEALFRFSEEGRPGGQVKSVVTPGLTLIDLQLQTGSPFELVDNQDAEGAESLFVLNGDVESHFDVYDGPLRFSSHQQSIQYNPHFHGRHLVRSNTFHAITISYDLSYLCSLLQSGSTGPLEDIANRISRKQAFLSMPYALELSSRISEVIRDMQRCSFTGITRYVFLESRMMELFVLQMEQLQAIHQGKPRKNWNRADVERFHAVREFIDINYLESFSLKDLTIRFGLNEFKLKKGYKELFGTTVFGQVHRLRMQKARTLLCRREMNVSEVAFHIGYENVSSFSTEFKKRFGYPPKLAS